MMTQAYPTGGNFDSFYRSPHRSMSNHYYEHNNPYSPYQYQPQPQHRRSHRSEYPGRHSTRTLIHNPEIAGPNGQAPRKRIGVACTRCRKRKIKCSGDVGDGSGCTACKAQGGETSMPCTFNRVNSENCDLIPEFEQYLSSTQPPASQGVIYDLDPLTTGANGQMGYHSLSHRQSLPALQTRGTYSEGYNSYSASPVDGYSYSSYSVPRNDSMSSSFDNGYRSWSNATTLPPASAASTYEQSPGYTFGSLSAPTFATQQSQPPQHQQQPNRLPSVTADNFSMGHLYTSLPTQTVQSRRLPIPQTTPSYEQVPYSGPELPEIRPLAEPRTRLSSVHSRIGAPWPGDIGYSDSRNGSSISLAPPNGMPMQPAQSTTIVQEPVVGYHYTSEALPATRSPSASPTACPTSSTSYPNGPVYSMSMTPTSYGSYYGLPPITTANSHRSSDANTSRTLHIPSSTSYSYNSETTTSSSSDRGSSDASSTMLPSTYASYPTIRHPQPQHAAGAEALRRQASFDQQHQHQQQHQRAGPTQRISVSDLSCGGPPYSAS